MKIVREPFRERKSKCPLLPHFEVLQKTWRKKMPCGVEQEALLPDAHFGRHGKQKLDQPMVKENRPDFNTVRHARGVEITQQARLQVRMNVHEGQPL